MRRRASASSPATTGRTSSSTRAHCRRARRPSRAAPGWTTAWSRAAAARRRCRCRSSSRPRASAPTCASVTARSPRTWWGSSRTSSSSSTGSPTGCAAGATRRRARAPRSPRCSAASPTTWRAEMPRKKTDAVLEAAIEPARRELLESTGDSGVGEHVGFTLEDDRLGTHWFEATFPGYRGWHWGVVVTRAPRSKNATVCESQLLPGEGALLSPEWVPWAERLAPGDVGPGDVTPKIDDDPNLVAGFEATGEEDVDAVALWELGLGRPRVLSAEGRDAAAQRWYDGKHGPKAEVALKAPAPCGECGYFLPMPGELRRVF